MEVDKQRALVVELTARLSPGRLGQFFAILHVEHSCLAPLVVEQIIVRLKVKQIFDLPSEIIALLADCAYETVSTSRLTGKMNCCVPVLSIIGGEKSPNGLWTRVEDERGVTIAGVSTVREFPEYESVMWTRGLTRQFAVLFRHDNKAARIIVPQGSVPGDNSPIIFDTPWPVPCTGDPAIGGTAGGCCMMTLLGRHEYHLNVLQKLCLCKLSKLLRQKLPIPSQLRDIVNTLPTELCLRFNDAMRSDPHVVWCPGTDFSVYPRPHRRRNHSTLLSRRHKHAITNE